MSSASFLIEERLNKSLMTSFPLEIVDDLEGKKEKKNDLDFMKRFSLKK
jgi:hypothetical protein